MASNERDIDAAERALGTLPRDGEPARDRTLREAWERRLAPLLDVIGPVEPPPDMFARITRQIDHEAVVADLSAWRARARRWRLAAATATAVAAASLLWVASDTPAPQNRYVAVVTDDVTGTAGLIIELDTATGVATVIPVVADRPADRSLEMWHLPEGAERPYSLGLLPANAEIRQSLVAGPGDIFAISFEPLGGSPTGQPTEPRFHGRIVKVE